MEDSVEIEVDARRRLPLAKIGPVADRYRVTRLDDGELLLTPVISISQRELAVLHNPERVASIRRGIEQAARGEVHRFDEIGDAQP